MEGHPSSLKKDWNDLFRWSYWSGLAIKTPVCDRLKRLAILSLKVGKCGSLEISAYVFKLSWLYRVLYLVPFSLARDVQLENSRMLLLLC